MATLKIGDLVTCSERNDWVGEVMAVSDVSSVVVVQWHSVRGTLLESQYENEQRLVVVPSET